MRQPDGKIVAVGRHGSDSDFALARYNTDGTLDTSFSGDGRQAPTSRASTGRTGWRSRRTARSSRPAHAQPCGADFALARYNPNGSLDTSFAGDGKLTTDFGGAPSAPTAVAIQADGKIVAVGVAGATRG